MRFLTFLFGLNLILSGISAQAHDGKGGMRLEPDPSTRSVALGEASFTEVGSIDAFASNPACLTSVGTLQISLKHSGLIQHLQSSSVSLSLGKSFGRSLVYPAIKLANRRFGLGFSLQHRSIELAQGSKWSSNTIFLGIGYCPCPYASAGLITKFLFSSDFEQVSASGFGIDLGARLEFTPRISWELVIRNLAGTVTWKNASDEKLPLATSLSLVAKGPFMATASARFGWSMTGGKQLAMGVEVPVYRRLKLRTELLRLVSASSRTILTGGFGLELGSYKIGYAFRSDAEQAFGLTHHFSITFNIFL